ncbi:hypothetical protein HAX54_035410, partial [Datura stramonium]|nr:hypothetical protein [Datura stramonium]
QVGFTAGRLNKLGARARCRIALLLTGRRAPHASHHAEGHVPCASGRMAAVHRLLAALMRCLTPAHRAGHATLVPAPHARPCAAWPSDVICARPEVLHPVFNVHAHVLLKIMAYHLHT